MSSRLALLLAPILGASLACNPAVGRIRAPVVRAAPQAASPAGARALFLRGAVLEARGQLVGAGLLLREASVLDPGSPWLRVRRADLALAEGDLGGASALLAEATSLDPGCAPAWAKLAVVSALAGDLQTAELAGEKATGLDPDLWQAVADHASRALSAGDEAKARALIAAWSARPAIGAAELAARGEARSRVGDWGGAQSDLGAALLLGAGDAAVRDGYLVAIRNTRHFRTALSVTARAAMASPADPGLVGLWWSTAALSGDPLALADAEAALLALVPSWSPPAEGVRSAPDRSEGQRATAVARAALQNPADLPAAERDLREALEHSPADPELWAAFEAVLRASGNAEEADFAARAQARHAGAGSFR